jgi:hypothetical protein
MYVNTQCPQNTHVLEPLGVDSLVAITAFRLGEEVCPLGSVWCPRTLVRWVKAVALLRSSTLHYRFFSRAEGNASRVVGRRGYSRQGLCHFWILRYGSPRYWERRTSCPALMHVSLWSCLVFLRRWHPSLLLFFPSSLSFCPCLAYLPVGFSLLPRGSSPTLLRPETNVVGEPPYNPERMPVSQRNTHWCFSLWVFVWILFLSFVKSVSYHQHHHHHHHHHLHFNS